tara:strand:- start:111 stop:290 length:180 start_codon:yes stop_codon:yes gene_type:complete
MKLLTALAITAVMFASSSSAFDPDDLQKLEDANLTFAIVKDVILCNTIVPDGLVIYRGC